MCDICVSCGETLTPQVISRTYHFAGRDREVKGINAMVCNSCGEIYLSSEEAKKIEFLLHIGANQ